MSYTGSMGDAFKARHEAATKAALTAAAQVVVNGLKEPKPEGLTGGYTSGDFVTGQLLNSIIVSDTQKDAKGTFVTVGTDLMYAVYWEFGHVNVFTRKYEREERWGPTLARKQDDIIRAYQRVYAR